ncbi:hypothetical protein L2E82_50286 [Cichorium intybus]|nr:hypothetical protein L2E82_50286 [Cichorium intybus]
MSPRSSNVQNGIQTMPIFWPNSGGLPPPYPPPSAVGQEPIYYPNNQAQSWAIGLYDCYSDFKISFLVLLCPCVAFGKIAEIVNEGETSWTEPGTLYCFLYVVQIGFMELLDYTVTETDVRWERNMERYRYATTMYPQAPPLVQEMSR